MKQCGKLVTMGHGDHAKCGEDYWGKFFQCDVCKLADSEAKLRAHYDNKDKIYTWPAQAAKDAESSSPTTPNSPTLAPEAWKILSDRVSSIEDQLHVQYLTLKSIQKSLETLTAALAEDQDPDDVPQTYLDGSKI